MQFWFTLVFCRVPTSQLLSTDSGATIRVALADESSALSGMAESEPACKQRKKTA